MGLQRLPSTTKAGYDFLRVLQQQPGMRPVPGVPLKAPRWGNGDQIGLDPVPGMVRDAVKKAGVGEKLEEAVKSSKAIKDVAKKLSVTEKAVQQAKKITDLLQKGLFKQVNPKLGAAVSAAGQLASAAFTTFLVLKQGEIQTYQLQTDDYNRAGVQDAFTRSINNTAQIRALKKQLASSEKKFTEGMDKTYAEAAGAARNSTKAREIANNALYETRQGRKILEGQIAAAKKIGNDALYEVRVGRQKLELQINNIQTNIQSKINQTISNISQGFQQQLSATIANIQRSLAVSQAQTARTNNEIANQNAKINSLQASNNSLTAKVNSIKQPAPVDTNAILNSAKSAATQEVSNLKSQVSSQINGLATQLTGVQTIIPVLASSISTVAQTVAQNQKTSDSKQIALTNTSQQASKRMAQIEADLKTQNTMNEKGLSKLDELGRLVALVPQRTADLVPDKKDIGNVVTGSVCNSVNGGCLARGLNDTVNQTANQVNTNTDNKLNQALDYLNTGANAVQTALLTKIDLKLGDQLEGGISKFLTKNFKWLNLDRITNMITLWVTIHNASMLSAQLGDTLLTVIENGLTIFGITDAEGQAIDLNEYFGKQIEAILKSVVGADNYTQMQLQWQRASTIYRSTANVIDKVSGLTNSVINGLEVIGGQNAKIGNALRNWDVVGPTAYEVFNPSPNFKVGGILDKLNNLDDAANFLLQVSQVPIDVLQAQKDFNDSTTEFIKTLREETKKGVAIANAEKTKQLEDDAKAASQGVDVEPTDKAEAEVDDE